MKAKFELSIKSIDISRWPWSSWKPRLPCKVSNFCQNQRFWGFKHPRVSSSSVVIFDYLVYKYLKIDKDLYSLDYLLNVQVLRKHEHWECDRHALTLPSIHSIHKKNEKKRLKLIFSFILSWPKKCTQMWASKNILKSDTLIDLMFISFNYHFF